MTRFKEKREGSIISNSDPKSSSPQVNLRERDACKMWNFSGPTHEAKQALERTS